MSEIDLVLSVSTEDAKEYGNEQEIELSLSTPSSITSGRKTSLNLVPNAAKQLSHIMATDAMNRICADCRVPLVDLSKIFASFYDPHHSETGGPSDQTRRNSDNSSNYTFTTSSTPRTFVQLHEMFAPKNVEPSTVNKDLRRRGLRAKWVDEMRAFESIGHAVFICDACAQAHQTMGSNITQVKSITTGQWSQRQLDLMKTNLGNSNSRVVLEQFIPSKWKKKIPNGFSPGETREVFVRAKYEALAFVLPHCPLGRNIGERWEERSSKKLIMNKDGGDKVLPPNLVDHFCVISPSEKLETHPRNPTKFPDLSQIDSIDELRFAAQVSDSFPGSSASNRSSLPPHLDKFVFPDGCRPRYVSVYTELEKCLSSNLPIRPKKCNKICPHLFLFHFDIGKWIQNIWWRSSYL